MRKLITNPLAPVLPVLVVATVLTACAGNDNADTAEASPTTEATTSIETSAATQTEPTTEAAPTTEATTGSGPTPGVGSCDEAAVRNAILNSAAVAPDLSFEFTYLKCAEGFGWAVILADYGDEATVLFKGSGTDIELLNLGTSVCATDSGVPADIAAELSPDPRNPLGDCP